MLTIRVYVADRDGNPLGPAFDLADVPSQLAALEYIQSLLTVAGANVGSAWWGNPQQAVLDGAFAAAVRPGQTVRILGVKPEDVVLVGD